MSFNIQATQSRQGSGDTSFLRSLITLIDAHGQSCETDVRLDVNGITLTEQGKNRSYKLTWIEIIEMALNAGGRSQAGPPSEEHYKRFNDYFGPLRAKMESMSDATQGELFHENS